MSTNKKSYFSWDYFQRTVKHSKALEANPLMKERVEVLMNEIEIYLDGPNENFDQKVFLRKRNDLHKLIKSVDSSELERKAS